VIEAGLQSDGGLPHRSQVVGTVNGVTFVNDSKATNVDSATKALQAFAKVRWICGGLAKEGGVDALLPHVGSVAKAYVIGREAAQFAMDLKGVETEVCTTMEAAVKAAVRDAEEGDVVLLAPACASFDQYDNFEKRGEDFIANLQTYLG
jgi:UDP-N-acetylmuramoylalanine--D-glutamate ligase